MKDVPFYAVTLANGLEQTFLVTGILKHFPDQPFIVFPADFVRKLNELPTKYDWAP